MKFKPQKILSVYYITFVIVAIIILLKVYAYWASGAMVIMASLVDSLIDASVSLLTFLSVRVSLKPADEQHRFGYGKIEGFSAIVQSSLMLGAATFLILEMFYRLSKPVELSNHKVAIVVSIISMALTLILVFIQRKTYKEAPSLALKADEQHYSSDILLNFSVIAGLCLDLWFRNPWLEILIGVGIAIYVAKTGFVIGREAFDMLMDREISDKERDLIISRVLSHKEVSGIHDLRTRKSGMRIYISFDVELEPSLSLKQAHDIDPKGDTFDPRHKTFS